MLLALVGLLCAAGLVSGAALRTAEAAHHHHAPAIAAVAKIADGHGTSPRSEQHLLAAAGNSVARPVERGETSDAVSTSSAGEATATQRTRGPPGPA